MILYVIFVSGEMIGAHLARNEQKTLLNAAGNGSTGPNCSLHSMRRRTYARHRGESKYIHEFVSVFSTFRAFLRHPIARFGRNFFQTLRRPSFKMFYITRAIYS